MTLNESEELLAIHLQELGLHFERQYAYCPGRKFRADFAVWRTERVQATTTGPDTWVHLPRPFALIEVQGGAAAWGKKCPLCGRAGRGAHGSITGVLADNARLYHAFRNGWHMIRVTPDQVKSGEAKRLIQEALKA